jgi:hypothetical protein
MLLWVTRHENLLLGVGQESGGKKIFATGGQ